MSNFQLYSLVFVTANGTLLAEEQQINMRRLTGSQRILTVAKGFCGVSPGAGLVEIDVVNAIPQGGFEFDMGTKMLGLIPIDVGLLVGGTVSMKGRALVEEDSVRHGVNQEATYEFRAVMPISLFQ